MATRSSGVMPRFVGGPNTEFISGKLTTIRGASRLLMSTTETRSLPGGRSWTLPVSSHVTFSSMPTIMYCGPGTIEAVVAHADTATPASNVSPRLHQFPDVILRCALIEILPVPRLGPHRGTTGAGSAIGGREPAAFFGGGSALANVRGLKALGAARDVELHLIAFREALEPLGGDRAEVHEHVLAVLLRDDPEPLRVVEPLHSSLCHDAVPSCAG